MHLLLDRTPRMLVRSLTPSDRGLLEAGFGELSEQSRFYRFLMRRDTLTDEELDTLTAPDSDRRVVLGAIDIDSNPPHPVGLVRYVRAPDDERTAEVAITIVDRYQGQGLGTALMGLLAGVAVGNGIAAFTALVHAENERMLEIFRAAGSTLEPALQGEVHVTMPLYIDPRRYPDNPVGETLRDHVLLAGKALQEAA